MATAVLPSENDQTTRIDMEIDDRHGWGFALLLATTMTLFIRPADLMPSLDQWPIYQVLILACIIVSSRTFARHLRHSNLKYSPITACLLLMLVAVGASHLSHGYAWGARSSMYEFAKLVAFYLLTVSLVNTPKRLFVFAKVIAWTIAAIAALSIMDHYGYISMTALESIRDRSGIESGEAAIVERLRGTGIFQDPNDFGLALVAGACLGLHFLTRPGVGLPRYLWLAPIATLLFAFALTHSRGAMLSFACILPALLIYRSGPKMAFLSLASIPVVASVFSGRMTDMGAIETGTGQSRIQIWSESLSLWRRNPLFGIGEGMLVEEINVVSHNSFIHCFAELGLLGGTAFLSSFMLAGYGLWTLRRDGNQNKEAVRFDQDQRDLEHLRMFVFAMLVAYAAGLFTLSRHMIVPTYLMLGIATASQAVGTPKLILERFCISNRMIFASVATSCLFLLASSLFVRVMVRW